MQNQSKNTAKSEGNANQIENIRVEIVTMEIPNEKNTKSEQNA